MYKKIVVPTDGSDVSMKALKHAIFIAKNLDSKIYGVYVVDVSPFIGLPMEGSWELITKVLEEEGEEILNKVKEMCEKEGVDVEVKMLEGIPPEEIVKFAEEKEADLIVMGTTGKTGLERILLGSVAERVIKNAPCPVLVVKRQSP
ncbi:UspA domain protein [Methanocaldococcus infernus ME]|uniref:UspA domain protein n=1 Tax=Methanocaldococcus infernus (strain DSM 11812 / JCM 15783 / ME) TaxID=573063 RepID=D5VQX9_METIM|nr:universal stress protein [Methanocaldococcus infernus]ADG12982.1 UspA domain protein [Methanocaldococcus infernus ME]